VVRLGVWAYVFACSGLIALVLLNPAHSSTHTAHLALVFFGGLTGSFVYTGGRFPLKYVALGDVLILIVFGPLSQLFAFMAQGGRADLGLPTLRYALPLALGTEAILHSNNTRDMGADRHAGLVTVPILIGPAAAHVLFAAYLFGPYTWYVCLALHSSVFFLLPLITLPRAFHIERDFRAHRLQHVPTAAARLNAYAALFYVTALALTPANQLPWLQQITFAGSSPTL
jgi:1,4-dihydroxy-2-naphthoate octaprenyltransferase